MTVKVKHKGRIFGENSGKGSSGSWRDPEVDTTQNYRIGRGDHAAAETKLPDRHPHDPPIIERKIIRGNLRPMKYVSLHHHSTYSYLDGYQLPEAHVRRAAELQMDSMVLTEHGNVDSHVKFEIAAQKLGVKPIFGCEVYMPVGPDWMNPDTQTQRKHHLTVIAKDQVGYSNLMQLITKSNINHYYDPLVTWNDLVEHKEGLIVLSGCSGSLLFCSAVGGKGIEPEDASYKRALRIARLFAQTFGNNYWIEVQAFPELESTRAWCAIAPRIAHAVKRGLVATMDCHYTTLDENEVQKILHNLRGGEKRTLEEQARDWGYNVPLCPPINDNQIYRRLRLCGLSQVEAQEAISSTRIIADGCTCVLPKLPMVRFPLPNGTTAKAYWRKLLREGWKFRGLDRRVPSERARYKAQLRHEVALIESKDFVDYFLLVAAGTTYVKGELGVPVGWARGSAAASIAAWLLRITEVDPLRPEFEGLLKFERFISADRIDLPDIDLDFPGEVRPFVRKFYEWLMGGPENVANVGTFTGFKGKNSLDDIARVFKVPKYEVERLKDFLIERSSGDLRASSTILDTVEQFDAPREIVRRNPDLKKAELLEGNFKAFGIHAAGLVLANEPISNITAVLEREVPKGSGNWLTAVAMDKRDAERQGMVKLDILGLNTMSMIWKAIQWMGKDLDWLYNMPLNDPSVYKLLQDVDVAGVFSMEGRSQRYVCSMIKPEKFSEIMDCGALCRPGPLHNGAAREYGEIKQGKKIAIAPHPVLADLLGTTHYQMVYQEQILSIARVVGNFDDVGVSDIRKIIAQKYGVEAFSRRRAEFMAGAKKLHLRSDYPPFPESLAADTFGNMITAGAYAFNAAHCAAYGLITNFTAWLKVHEPAILYAGQLCESVKDKPRTRMLLRDAGKHDVKTLPPSLKKSTANWQPVIQSSGKPSRRLIRPGFISVEGVGEKSAPVIEKWRDETHPTQWSELKQIRGFGDKTVATITDWISNEDPHHAFKLDGDIALVKEQIAAGDLGELPEPSHTASDLALDAYAGKALKVFWVGTFVQRNIRDIFEQNRARGKPLDPAKTRDPHLNEWAMLTGEDETDQLLIKIDRWHYPVFKQAIFEFKMGEDLLLVEGVKPARSGVRTIHMKRCWVLQPE